MTAPAPDAATPETLSSGAERPVAVHPVPDRRRAKAAQVRAEMDALAAEISAAWPAGVTAAEAVQEQRREL